MVEQHRDSAGGRSGSWSDVESLAAVQSRLVNRALVVVVALSTPVVVASVARGIDLGWQSVFGFHIAAMVFGWVAVLLRGALSTDVRAGLILLSLWVAACATLFQFGLLGQSTVLFFLACILATVFYGIRAGLLLLGVALAVVTAGVISGVLLRVPTIVEPRSYASYVSSWVLFITVLACLPTAAILTLSLAQDVLRVTMLSLAARTSELERSNAALLRSEERYRQFIQNFSGIAYQLSPTDLRPVLFEGRLQEITGYTEEDFALGAIEWHQLVHLDDVIRVAEEGEKLASTPGYRANHEYRIFRKDGQMRWVLDVAQTASADHQPGLIHGAVYDITDRKLAEEALRESEERYKAIFDSNTDAFLVFDLDGNIVDANVKAREVYGYSAEELVNLSGHDIVEPKHYNLFQEFESVSPGKWFEAESVDVRKGGALFDVEVHGTRLIYGGKELLFSIVRDITERKKSRDAMRAYADIVRNMQVGLYVYHLEDPKDDMSLVLVSANPASTTALGLSEGNLIGKRIDEVFPGLRERGIPQRFAEVARTGEPFVIDDFAYGDVRVQPRYFSFRAFPIPDNSVGVLFEDTTARKQAEVALRRAEEEKRQFYRETISSVTDGKLQVVGIDESRYYLSLAEIQTTISTHAEAAAVRRTVEEYCRDHGLEGDDLVLFVTGVGEAMNNSIKHAGSAVVFAGVGTDTVWVGCADHGPGIATITLPSATLRRGYSTKVSMGMGYSIMLEVSDRIVLSTGHEGTTVVLVKSLTQTRKPLSLDDLPDTWSAVGP